LTFPFKFHSEICRLECYRGYCQNQKCICNPGWGGALCDQLSCDPRCDDFKGKCENGTCVCRKGWNGKHCTIGMAPLTYVCVTTCFLLSIYTHMIYLPWSTHLRYTVQSLSMSYFYCLRIYFYLSIQWNLSKQTINRQATCVKRTSQYKIITHLICQI